MLVCGWECVVCAVWTYDAISEFVSYFFFISYYINSYSPVQWLVQAGHHVQEDRGEELGNIVKSILR